MYMTLTEATDEQHAAAFYLGSLEDPLPPWVHATGPFDVYAMHLPAAVRDPLEWLSRITPKAAEQRSQAWRPCRLYETSYLWGYIWAMDHPGAS
jgi:hypothetical protein